MPNRSKYLPHAWAVLLVLLMLGPALGPGYVLSYDMVWVPHLAMRSDLLGLGSALPRAVPSDAVVAILDGVVPAMLLQKIVLVGPPLAAAAGMLRLVGPSLVTRLVVVTLTVWNPFTVERLGIGHWTVLLGYAVLPWLVLAGFRARSEGLLPRSVWLLLPLGSLSASAGLVSAAAVLVTGGELRSRSGRLRTLGLAALCAAANAPWVVTGLLHARAADRSGGFSLFALHGEGPVPAPLAALTLGGIWNAQVVPASRQSFLQWLVLLLLVGLAVLGARAWWTGHGRSRATRLLVLWGLGLGVAVVSWLVPEAGYWLARTIPGGGVLRDGGRSLALCLPVAAGLPATGAGVLARTLARGDRSVRAMVGGLCAVLPVLLLYDAAWGLSGSLRATQYPASWQVARARLGEDHGMVLLLPFSAYRAPSWNHGHTVLDPLGRYLEPDYLMADALVVGGRTVPGEDPLARRAARALRLPTPDARATALRGLGVGSVATELDTAGPAPRVPGPTLVDAGNLRVQILSGAVASGPRRSFGQRAAVAVAWLLYAVMVAIGCGVGLLWLAGRSVLRRRTPSR